MAAPFTEFLLILILAVLLLIISALLSTGFKVTPEKFLVFDPASRPYQVIFGIAAALLLVAAFWGKFWAGGAGSVVEGLREVQGFSFPDAENSSRVQKTIRSDGVTVYAIHEGFTERFTRAPIVHLSLAGFQLLKGNERFELHAANVTPSGFDVELWIWKDSPRPSVVTYSWIAIQK